MESQRLQKVLASAGLGSRRACDALVAAGRVRVNGAVAEPGTRVDPNSDLIEVDGIAIAAPGGKRVVLALNKPAGVVTTMSDEQGRPCVGDLFRDYPQRLFHIGRLDEATEGLLLLTNDGDFANLLMHPSHGVEKTYVARVSGRMEPGTAQALVEGVELGDGPARAVRVAIRTAGSRASIVELVLHEGRKHIVRRMCKAVGHPVEHLVRVRIGDLELGELPSGQWRTLSDREVESLRSLAQK